MLSCPSPRCLPHTVLCVAQVQAVRHRVQEIRNNLTRTIWYRKNATRRIAAFKSMMNVAVDKWQRALKLQTFNQWRRTVLIHKHTADVRRARRAHYTRVLFSTGNRDTKHRCFERMRVAAHSHRLGAQLTLARRQVERASNDRVDQRNALRQQHDNTVGLKPISVCLRKQVERRGRDGHLISDSIDGFECKRWLQLVRHPVQNTRGRAQTLARMRSTPSRIRTYVDTDTRANTWARGQGTAALLSAP